MSLLSVASLSKSCGAADVFTGLSFSLARRARVALVGPNGVGKTTLLRILVGEEEPSSGTVARARGVRVGYLPQEADFEMSGTLWESCLAPFASLISQQEELQRLEVLMADPSWAGSVLPRYGAMQQDFERRGGYTYPMRIEQVLTGLGFDEADYHLPLDRLSGGQRTRAYLARTLLSDPDLLLLDEPTNHLDIAAIEWLEGYLAQWGGAALIVSHDRYFLDRVCNAVLEMLPGSLELYRGNYSAYLRQRQERAERRQEVFEAEKEKLLKEARYIKKYIAGQNVSQARGRLRRLSRILQAIEQVGVEAVLSKKWSEVSEDVSIAVSDLSPEQAERRVRALQSPVRRLPRLNLQLRSGGRSGDLVIRTRHLQIGYPGKLLFEAPDIVLRRGACAALIGPNGAGKTTFLKTVLGEHEPLAGEVILGASLQVGYFAQAHEGLDPQRTVMEEIAALAPGWLPGQIRDYLGRYLFSGDDVFKKVEVLSGGERGRLALAKLALQDANLLLLDEPTNHLDIPSQEILQAVLNDFGGTILLVSHDRYLIDALATQIWEINLNESALTVFNGTYSQMKEEREKKALLEGGVQSLQTLETGAKKKQRRETLRQAQGKALQSEAKAERRKIAQLQELENVIAALEADLANLGAQLESPFVNPKEVAVIGKEYERVQREMDEKLREWEEMQAH